MKNEWNMSEPIKEKFENALEVNSVRLGDESGAGK